MVRSKKKKSGSKSRTKQSKRKNDESNSKEDRESFPPLNPPKPDQEPVVPESKAEEVIKTARDPRRKDTGSRQRQSVSRSDRNRRTITRSRTRRRSRSRRRASSLRIEEDDARTYSGRQHNSRKRSSPRPGSRRSRTYQRCQTPVRRLARRSRAYTYRRRSRSRSRSRHSENPFGSKHAKRVGRDEAREQNSRTT